MDTHPTVYWLWLIMVFGIANARLPEIIRNTESVRELYYALHDPDCGLLNDKERRCIRNTSLEKAQQLMAYCEKNGIGIMTWDDALYPDSLRNIYNPPTVLFYRGNPSLLQHGMLLTAVGTRHPSEYSRKVADWLCTDLARCNLILCSGCAVGLDAAVHWAAIRQNTPTIAVLASGVDYDYPRENREMKERIVQNGLLLSEYVPGSKPLSFHFHARNRILAGISESVLVLEASTRSGALITANYACEQGKTVFCVPPADLFDKRYGGVVNFMRDGAYPVFNYLDVLYAYYLKYPHRLSLYDDTERSRTTDSLLFAEEKPSRRPCRTKVPAAAAETSEPPASYAFPAEATEPQRRILELLQKGRYTVNAICMELQMSFDEVSILVLEMELSGWIVNVERDTFMLPEGSAC